MHKKRTVEEEIQSFLDTLTNFEVKTSLQNNGIKKDESPID